MEMAQSAVVEILLHLQVASPAVAPALKAQQVFSVKNSVVLVAFLMEMAQSAMVEIILHLQRALPVVAPASPQIPVKCRLVADSVQFVPDDGSRHKLELEQTLTCQHSFFMKFHQDLQDLLALAMASGSYMKSIIHMIP